MHESSMETMRNFVNDYGLTHGQTIVDIGSLDINGNYKSLFETGDSKYIGVDIVDGPNVDVLIGSSAWEDLKNVDAVISGQTLEHVEDIPLLMSQIMDILKPGGLLCIIAPSTAPPHDYPIWVGNFSVERMTSIVKNAGFEIILCVINPASEVGDCCCIARKPNGNN